MPAHLSGGRRDVEIDIRHVQHERGYAVFLHKTSDARPLGGIQFARPKMPWMGHDFHGVEAECRHPFQGAFKRLSQHVGIGVPSKSRTHVLRFQIGNVHRSGKKRDSPTVSGHFGWTLYNHMVWLTTL